MGKEVNIFCAGKKVIKQAKIKPAKGRNQGMHGPIMVCTMKLIHQTKCLFIVRESVIWG